MVKCPSLTMWWISLPLGWKPNSRIITVFRSTTYSTKIVIIIVNRTRTANQLLDKQKNKPRKVYQHVVVGTHSGSTSHWVEARLSVGGYWDTLAQHHTRSRHVEVNNGDTYWIKHNGRRCHYDRNECKFHYKIDLMNLWINHHSNKALEQWVMNNSHIPVRIIYDSTMNI